MIIKNGNVVTPYELLRATDVKIEDGKIAGIGRKTKTAIQRIGCKSYHFVADNVFGGCNNLVIKGVGVGV